MAVTAVAMTTNQRPAGRTWFIAERSLETGWLLPSDDRTSLRKLEPQRHEAPAGHRDRVVDLCNRPLAGVAHPGLTRPGTGPGQADLAFLARGTVQAYDPGLAVITGLERRDQHVVARQLK